MSLSLPPGWPQCTGQNTDPRSPPECKARGDGWGQRCRHHGGLDIPEGPYAVVVSPSGVFVWRTLRGALDGRDGAHQRVSWRIAVLLVQSGQIDRGMFFGRRGTSLLRELEASGVEVKIQGPRGRTRLAITRYAFRRRAAA